MIGNRHNKAKVVQWVFILFLAVGLNCFSSAAEAAVWTVDTDEQWRENSLEKQNIEYKDGLAAPLDDKAEAVFTSVIKTFDEKRSAKSITFQQSAVWRNWKRVESVKPSNIQDAPIFLSLGDGNYWIFGRYGKMEGKKDFIPEKVRLKGFDCDLYTTPDPHQYDAAGAAKPDLGGYHAWQSRDMKNWVHHGNVTKKFSQWATTAEYVDGKFYIYYDYPNDQDPHLYIDEDITDGLPGRNMGLAFKDPSDGSDCAVIRDLDGNFHIIYEDWSPINAGSHSWDSPLAGHSVSEDGAGDFNILHPVVDERTKPTGEIAEYLHPHWIYHPDWDSATAEYQVHEPEQNAFGDWAAIAVGSRYYLFGDFHPAVGDMGVGWFTSESLNEPFERCGRLESGHPDPDIGFAEGKFYLITQAENDFVSDGPWVEGVLARVGVDSNGDGQADSFTEWSEVKEAYGYTKGYAKQIKKTPAGIDLSGLPAGFAFKFEFKITPKSQNNAPALIDRVEVIFE